MVVKKRVLAPVAFASTLAAAGMAALALTAAPQGQESASDRLAMSLSDVQIGERGNQTRIAFLCGGACVLEKRSGGEFFLNGVEASFDLDLSGRSERLRFLRASASKGGVALKLETAGVIEFANVKNCTVGGIPAACLDLFFEDDGGLSAADKNGVQKAVEAPSAEPSQKPAQTAQQQPANETADETPLLAKVTPENQSPEKPKLLPPGLRETASDRYMTFATLAAPERLQPPSNAVLAKVQPIEKTVEVQTPAVRLQEPLSPKVKDDFAERVRAILGKKLTSAYCNNAETTLQADAWAMSAMVDVGLCAAARGDASGAEQILARLLQYTPDNYEAYVGRALIAEEAGEKGVARKYYQDALNSPPPIEESTRIIEAMAKLDERR